MTQLNFPQLIESNPVFKTAFTHRSFLNESPSTKESNERLEFLGDSVLSLIVSKHLYEIRPGDAEGDLTNLRSYIVKTTSLATAAKEMRLGDYLLLSKGEEMSGGRENVQLLANTFESVLGAIFLEHGIEKAQDFIFESLLPHFQKEITSGPPKDAKSLLQERAQTQTKQSPKYKILSTSGPDHAKEFIVGVFLQGAKIGEGRGSAKQIAEEEAAAHALEELGKSSSGI
jgi:ribonuclease-3